MNTWIKKIFSAGLLAGAFATSAMAQDGVYLGEPGFAGSGCPVGSAAVVLSPDLQELSILFDQYFVEAGGASGRTIDRKNCTLAVPVHIPSGYSVTLIRVDYRGFNSLPRGAMSRFTANYFFAGSTGPTQSKTFYGGTEGDYLLTSNLLASSLVWSACGDDVTLRAATSLFLRNPNTSVEAISSVDSADISAAVVYRLSWRRC